MTCTGGWAGAGMGAGDEAVGEGTIVLKVPAEVGVVEDVGVFGVKGGTGHGVGAVSMERRFAPVPGAASTAGRFGSGGMRGVSAKH